MQIEHLHQGPDIMVPIRSTVKDGKNKIDFCGGNNLEVLHLSDSIRHAENWEVHGNDDRSDDNP